MQKNRFKLWTKGLILHVLSTTCEEIGKGVRCVRVFMNTFIRPKTETDRQADRYIQMKT